MSNVHGLTKENLLFTFPASLRENPSIAALGDVTMEALAKRPAEIALLSLYPRIDELPEALLDILAYDFKVDWWDADYSLEEKRRTFKDSWRVHKTLGTKAAVETAIRAIYPKARVQEWFEYEGGKPYHFKLDIDLTNEISDAARPYRVLERVNFYKSLRSHVDEFVFTIVLPPATLHVGGGVGAKAEIGIPLEPDTFDFRETLRVGGDFGTEASLGGSAEPDAPRFQAALHAGGALSIQSAMPVPEDAAQPSATTILHTGGVCTIISNLSKGD